MLRHIVNILPHACISISYPLPIATNRKYNIRSSSVISQINILYYFYRTNDIARARYLVLLSLDCRIGTVFGQLTNKELLPLLLDLPYTKFQARKVLDLILNIKYPDPILNPLILQLCNISNTVSIPGYSKLLNYIPTSDNEFVDAYYDITTITNNFDEVEYLLNLVDTDAREAMCNEVMTNCICAGVDINTAKLILSYATVNYTTTYAIYTALVYDRSVNIKVNNNIITCYLDALYNNTTYDDTSHIVLENICELEPLLINDKRIALLAQLIKHHVRENYYFNKENTPGVHKAIVKCCIDNNLSQIIEFDDCEYCKCIPSI